MKPKHAKPGPLTPVEKMSAGERSRILADAPRIVARCMEMGLCKINKWRVPPIHQIAKDDSTGTKRAPYTRMSDAEREALDKEVGVLVKRGFTSSEISRKLSVHSRVVDRSRERMNSKARKGGGR